MSPAEKTLARLRQHVPVHRQGGMTDEQYERHAALVRIASPITEEEAEAVRQEMAAQAAAELAAMTDAQAVFGDATMRLDYLPPRGELVVVPVDSTVDSWWLTIARMPGGRWSPDMNPQGRPRQAALVSAFEDATKQRHDLTVWPQPLDWDDLDAAIARIPTVEMAAHIVREGLAGEDRWVKVTGGRFNGVIGDLDKAFAGQRDAYLNARAVGAMGAFFFKHATTLFDVVAPNELPPLYRRAYDKWESGQPAPPSPAPEPEPKPSKAKKAA